MSSSSSKRMEQAMPPDDNSDFSDVSEPESSKGKGKASAKDASKPVKRRSSKACDNCRRQKTKCERVVDTATKEPVGPCANCASVGAECTYLGASRKRGPPKGYIEAIETRLHRMEALLGGLLQNDDPRAAQLLGELIGNEEARDVLTKDLKAASAAAPSAKPRKSWKKAESPAAAPILPPSQAQPIVSRGFSATTTAPDLTLPDNTPRWFTDEELGFASGQGPAGSFDPGSFASTSSLTTDAFGLMGSNHNTFSFDAAGQQAYRGNSDIDSPASLTGGSPSVNSGTGAPLQNDRSTSTSGSLPSSMSIPLVGTAAVEQSSSASAPRQRRRLNSQSPLFGTSNLAGANVDQLKKSMAFDFPSQTKQNMPPTAINHTGTASYSLGADAQLAQSADGDEPTHAISELADVVGQLSLNENAEVRYHGRSSGLYLISKSARYKNFFWQFPSAGVWPASDSQVLKTEKEILALSDAEDPLPDRATQQHLLDLYWTYVHPHFPILYKVSFMRQYRHSISNPDSTEPSTPAGSGKVPMVLLLSMFALAARYSDLDPARSDGKYWTAGQDYLDKARRVLNYDYGSSKLVSVQALLLMAYREIGTGAMSASWLFTGMAIRMAQDLGLFRDVEKWFLPVQRFSHEEKQTRKRVWWGCIILDRYTASYIGRPGTIHERDYDTSFPSEDEPDEHEQWRPIRPDGTEWSMSPKNPEEAAVRPVKTFPPTKAHTLSCFNAAGALAVVINRIIANIYAIRIRVLGQSSETLLSLLDQSLASWYLALPPHLAYNPASKKVPPPHVLSLHLQFYSALILLHRPFIPGQNSTGSLGGSFPSHSICTTSANAIANIVTIFRKQYTLRQCPPFLTYPIFSAAVICVYNASFDDALAQPAKRHLAQCMSALKDMELIWGSAQRQCELLHGLVDLKDAELGAELDQGMHEMAVTRGTKRVAEVDSPAYSALPPTNFHARPLARAAPPQSKPRRRSSSSSHSQRVKVEPAASQHLGKARAVAQQGSPNTKDTSLRSTPPVPTFSSHFSPCVTSQAMPPPPIVSQGSQPSFQQQQGQTQPAPSNVSSTSPEQMFANFGPSGQNFYQQQMSPIIPTEPLPSLGELHGTTQPPHRGIFSHELPHQTYDILTAGGPALDLSQFRSPPGTSGGVTNFSELLNSFLSPTEAASATMSSFSDAQAAQSQTGAAQQGDFDSSAFFGLPLGADMTEEWASYLPSAFFSTGPVPDEQSVSSDQGSTGPSNPPTV